MDRAYDRIAGWKRTIAVSPRAPVGIALALGAVAESVARAALAPNPALSLVILPLLGLATTVPVALLWPQPAASAAVVSVTAVLSLAAFQTLTVAGAGAQLLAGHRLG
ncbi:MAG: hypothetical protein HOV86_07410, partial [Thermoactinospora sp.]|nr:hypothetical protein [Thermoactinospora sp.]